MDEIERRVYLEMLEVREEGGKLAIAGYAAVFNQWSVNLGGFRERIKPKAFREAIKGDVRALWQHDPLYVLGRSTTGTLRLTEDEHGLRVQIDPPDSQWARDALLSIKRGDVSQMSFGFVVGPGNDEWKTGSDGLAERTVLRFNELLDVSPVTYAAYPQTTVSARAKEMVAELRAHPLSDDNLVGNGEPARERGDLLRRVQIREKELI